MNFYELLGVRRTSTTEEIKAAKNALLRTIHPDAIDALLSRYSSSDDKLLIDNLKRQKAEALTKTQQINTAWETLSDTASRTAYDKTIFSYVVFDKGSIAIGVIASGQSVTSTLSVQNLGQNIKEPSYIGLERDDPQIVISLLSQSSNQRFPIGQRVIMPLPILVEIKITGTTPGTYSNELRFVFDGMSYRIPINYSVGNAPRLSVLKSSYSLGDFYRGERTGRKITVQNSGGPAARLTVAWSRTSQSPPNLQGIRQLVFPLSFEVIIDTSNCLPGNHREVLNIKADNQIIQVTFEFRVIPDDDDDLGPFPTL